MYGRVERVFASIEELIGALPVPRSHRELLRVHVGVGREQAEVYPELPAIRLPLLVHAAITGDEGPALPVAGACTLLYLGADLFDNLIDHELPSSWHARDPAEANLAAATLLTALPQLAIARLQERGTLPERLWTLAHLFADYGLTMGAGQYEDLHFPSLKNVSIEDSRVIAEHKSGAEYALFATAGATLATEDRSTIEAYAAFGSCFGIAQQLINDAQDIW